MARPPSRRTATRPPGSARTITSPTWQASPQGPFDHWPVGQGYDYFYGFVGGDTSQWQPGNLYRNTTPIHPYMGKPGWNLITAMADDCIEYISTQTATDPKRPWFIHYAPGATHAPHHPTQEWINKISAMHLFDDGWNAVAERIFENQKKLGVVPANAKLPPWPDFLPKWETLTADQKKLYLRQIDVWAAYMAYTDHEIGRIVETLEKLGLFENTLIMWVCGDNGMSAEGSLNGTPNEVAYFNGFAFTVEQMLPLIPAWGTDKTYPHFAVPWAFAMDTPYKWTKQIASHLGGTRTGMVVSWPKRIKDARRNPPPVPPRHRHRARRSSTRSASRSRRWSTASPSAPGTGSAWSTALDKANADAPTTRKTQYFEILGNRAIYHEGWMANTYPAVFPWEGVKGNPPVDVLNGFKWELFNLKDDPTQTNDLAAQEPERLKAMQELWMIEAVRNNVLPLNASQVAVLTVERPGPAAGRKQFVYTSQNASNQFSRRAVDPQPALHDHRRDRGAAGRGEWRAGDAGRTVLGLRPLSQGRQAHLHHEPARYRAAEVAERPAAPAGHGIRSSSTGSRSRPACRSAAAARARSP